MSSSSNGFYNTVRKGADIYLIPKLKHTHTVIFLHGLGNSADGFFDFFNATTSPTSANIKVVLLTAPIRPLSVNQGALTHSWFDIKDFNATESNFSSLISVSESDESAERIKVAIREEIAVLGGDSTKIFLAGFSQGAAMALKTSLTFEQSLAGVLVFSGFFFFGTIENTANKTLPILISHGTDDPLLIYDNCSKSYAKLDQISHKIRTDLFNNLGHNLDLRSNAVFKDFLAKHAV